MRGASLGYNILSSLKEKRTNFSQSGNDAFFSLSFFIFHLYIYIYMSLCLYFTFLNFLCAVTAKVKTAIYFHMKLTIDCRILLKIICLVWYKQKKYLNMFLHNVRTILQFFTLCVRHKTIEIATKITILSLQ